MTAAVAPMAIKIIAAIFIGGFSMLGRLNDTLDCIQKTTVFGMNFVAEIRFEIATEFPASLMRVFCMPVRVGSQNAAGGAKGLLHEPSSSGFSAQIADYTNKSIR